MERQAGWEKPEERLWGIERQAEAGVQVCSGRWRVDGGMAWLA